MLTVGMKEALFAFIIICLILFIIQSIGEFVYRLEEKYKEKKKNEENVKENI